MPGMKMKNYYKMMWEVRNHICSDPETFAEFLEYSRNQPGYPIIGATNVYTKYLREEKGIALDIDDNLSTGGH